LDSSVDLDSGSRTRTEIEEIAEKTEWDRIQNGNEKRGEELGSKRSRRLEMTLSGKAERFSGTGTRREKIKNRTRIQKKITMEGKI
jgi:hypothetical protein